MKISIIIPCFNEEDYLHKTLEHILDLEGDFETIVVDGGSSDNTLRIARRFKGIRAVNSDKGRANQMNYGAKMANGDILLFLHADTYLPPAAYESITAHLQNPGYIGGSFMLKLDKKHIALKFYTWCSRFSLEFFTYGDHAIFVKREVFTEIGGYKNINFMEDVEIQKRLRRAGKFKKLDTAVTTSARRFIKEGTIKQLVIDVLLVGLYKVGVPPHKLKRFYKDFV